MPNLNNLTTQDVQWGSDLWNNGFKNYLINGDFAINQRVFAGGALAAGIYGFDRWKAGTGGCSVSLSAGVLTHTSGPLVQVIEAPNLAGKTVTVSVDALTGGNLTASIDGVSGVIVAGAGRVGVAIAVPAGSTGNVTLTLTPVAGAVTYKRVQIELGSVATAFEWRPASSELALCQRYYARLNAGGIFQGFGSGIVASSTVCTSIVIKLPNTMRANPALVYQNLRIYDGTVFPAVTSVTSTVTTPDILNPEFTCSAGGLAIARLGTVQANNDINAFIAGDAEL